MTVNRLVELLATMNPGFFVMAAAIIVIVSRDPVTRAIALVGGPVVALLAMLYPPAAGIEVSRQTFLGFELALYRPDSVSLIIAFGFVLGAVLGGIYSLHRRDPMQDAAGLVYAGSAIGAVFAGDLLSIVLYSEIATLAASVLVFARRTGPAYRAGMRFLAIQLTAGLALLAGAALFGVE
jgi:multicomponent Na+:H+ antiporter subunit D